jgi:hypothetical protein
MDQTILVHVKLWMYSWFWNNLLDFLWSLPADDYGDSQTYNKFLVRAMALT